MINPGDIMKIAGLKNRFEKNHPGVARFSQVVARRGVPENTVLELKVTYPGEEPMVTNMRVTADDLAMLAELRSMNPQG